MAPRLYISTRDPREGGGVAAKAKFLYDTASDAGYDPCLVFNDLLDQGQQIRLSNPMKLVGFNQAESVKNISISGREAKSVPLLFPEIEFTQSIANTKAWRAAISDGDLFYAVCGTNLCTVPLVRMGVPFGSWTGTLLWEDRVDRLRSAPLIERVRDRLSRPILEYLEQKGYQSAIPAMVVSEYTAARVSEKHGIDRDCIDVVPFPIDIDRFQPPAANSDDSTVVILFAGRFNDPRKNISLLIAAFRRVREEHQDIELWLMGDEPDQRVQRLAKESGVRDDINFCGKVPEDELSKYYQRADIFAIPSNQEGLAIVGLEAMACATPVVTTDCGGPTQYVSDTQNGYIVPREDIGAFVDAIDSLMDRQRRETMGRAARELIERDYAEPKIRARFLETLKDLVERKE